VSFSWTLPPGKHNGAEFDEDGKLGREGNCHFGLLEEFLTYKYYQQKELPIGVGTDDFPETLWQEWQAKGEAMGLSGPDMVATFTELTAKQIALACKNFLPPNASTDDIILRGGIKNNSYFCERLAANLSEQLDISVSPAEFTTLEALNMDEDSWENNMYALFGYLCFRGLYNFVPSCTGAKCPVVGGRIAPGDNYASLYKRYEIF